MLASLYGAGAEYALHSMLILATRPGPVSVRDLARYQKLPAPFLAKLFARLKQAGLVRATEGVAGGVALARPAQAIAVGDILSAVDPGRVLFACAEIRQHCALFEAEPPAWAVAGSCRIHAFMQEAESHLQQFLAARTLADLVCEYTCKAPGAFAAATDAWFVERKKERWTRRDPS